MGAQIIVNTGNGVANVRTVFSKNNGNGGNPLRSIKPIDALRRQNRANIFKKTGEGYLLEDESGQDGCEKVPGNRKAPRLSRIARIAEEHEIPAMYLHISKIRTFRVAECCEKAAAVLFAYAKTGDLPSTYKTWQLQRASAQSMGPEAIFAYLEGAHKNPNEKLALFTLAAAASVGKQIAMAPQDKQLYGKTPGEWSQVIKDLAMRFAGTVEAEYSRIKGQKN